MEKREPSYTVGGNANWYNHCGEQHGDSLKKKLGLKLLFSSGQLSPTVCDPMDCSTPVSPVHHQPPELTQTHVHPVMMASYHLILCRPLLLLPPIPSSIRVFSNESTLRILEWVAISSSWGSSQPRDLLYCKWILYPLIHLGSAITNKFYKHWRMLTQTFSVY